jgi:hypothetical protein
MARLAEHPYLAGLAITVLIVASLHSIPAGMLGPTGVRGAGLIVYGGSLAVLMWNGLDRDDVWWFLFGGACGLALSLPLLL